MSIRYYRRNKNIKIYYSTTATYHCLQCRKEYGAGESHKYILKSITDNTNINDMIMTTTFRIAKIGKAKNIFCNHLIDLRKKERCDGIIELKGYVVWVEDCSKEKTIGGMFRTGSKEIERFWPRTKTYRDKIINELLTKYK